MGKEAQTPIKYAIGIPPPLKKWDGSRGYQGGGGELFFEGGGGGEGLEASQSLWTISYKSYTKTSLHWYVNPCNILIKRAKLSSYLYNQIPHTIEKDFTNIFISL